MSALIDLTGKIFGRWRVLGFAGLDANGSGGRWLCRCVCGTERTVRSHRLRQGKSRSCGCLSADLASQRRFVHGAIGTPAYFSWLAMRERCRNPNVNAWKRYGGRGISVCERWVRFENFFADMGERPKGKTIDRIDNDGPYAPGNCRWATPKEQRQNQAKNA